MALLTNPAPVLPNISSGGPNASDVTFTQQEGYRPQVDTGPDANPAVPSAPGAYTPDVETLQPPTPIDIPGEGSVYNEYSYNPSVAQQSTEFERYNVDNMDASVIDPVSPYNAERAELSQSGGYTPYNAQTVQEGTGQGTAVQGTVSDNATVEGRLSGLLSRNSDMSRIAETTANQQSNRRGLLNSSMAVGAARKAVIDSAMPIAQQDASTFASMENLNLQYENQMAQFNAQQELVLQQFNTGELNAAERDNALATIQDQQFNAELQHNTNTFNATQANEEGQFNADIDLQARTSNAGFEQDANRVNTDAENRAREVQATGQADVNRFNAEIQTSTDLANSAQEADAARTNALAQQQSTEFNEDLISRTNMFNAEQGMEAALANQQAYNDASTAFAAEMNKQNFAVLSTELNGWLQEMDGDIQAELAELESQYNLAENINSVNGAVYQEMVNGINHIMANTADVDEAAAKVSLMIQFAGIDYEYVTSGDETYAGLPGEFNAVTEPADINNPTPSPTTNPGVVVDGNTGGGVVPPPTGPVVDENLTVNTPSSSADTDGTNNTTVTAPSIRAPFDSGMDSRNNDSDERF